MTGLTVLMGGGRKWFLPNTSNSTSPQAARLAAQMFHDYVLTDDIVNGWGAAKGALDNARDLISDFQSAGYTYAPTRRSSWIPEFPTSCSASSTTPT